MTSSSEDCWKEQPLRYDSVMISLVTDKQEDLARICSRFDVLKLALFGSAAREDFQEGSDLDFVVEFADMSPDEHARAYFGLLKELEKLFDRKIDLVEVIAVRNPYVRRSIQESQVPLYAA